MSQEPTPEGWYHAEGDPPNTMRYWDGNQWTGGPESQLAISDDSEKASGQLASPGNRIAARLIDFVLFGLVGLVVHLVFGVGLDTPIFFTVGDGLVDSEFVKANEETISIAMTGVLGFLWDFLWTGSAAGTPGKLFLGLRVADASNRQSPPSPALAARRALNRILPLLGFGGIIAGSMATGLVFLVGVASLALLFVDDKHRTVMDWVGRTIVVTR